MPKPAEPGQEPKPQDHRGHLTIGWVIGSVLIIILGQGLLLSVSPVETIPYSQFLAMLQKGQIGEVTVSQNTIEGATTDSKPCTRRLPPALNSSVARSGRWCCLCNERRAISSRPGRSPGDRILIHAPSLIYTV